MTFLLAAVQHTYRQAARTAGAFLEALVPPRYESSDVLMDFEEEHEVHEPSGCADHPMPPAPVEAPTPGAGFSLPMFTFGELVGLAQGYIDGHRYIKGFEDDEEPVRCQCSLRRMSRGAHALHVAELIVSALTFELTSLAYEQNQEQS